MRLWVLFVCTFAHRPVATFVHVRHRISKIPDVNRVSDELAKVRAGFHTTGSHAESSENAAAHRPPTGSVHPTPHARSSLWDPAPARLRGSKSQSHETSAVSARPVNNQEATPAPVSEADARVASEEEAGLARKLTEVRVVAAAHKKADEDHVAQEKIDVANAQQTVSRLQEELESASLKEKDDEAEIVSLHKEVADTQAAEAKAVADEKAKQANAEKEEHTLRVKLSKVMKLKKHYAKAAEAAEAERDRQVQEIESKLNSTQILLDSADEMASNRSLALRASVRGLLDADAESDALKADISNDKVKLQATNKASKEAAAAHSAEIAKLTSAVKAQVEHSNRLSGVLNELNASLSSAAKVRDAAAKEAAIRESNLRQKVKRAESAGEALNASVSAGQHILAAEISKFSAERSEFERDLAVSEHSRDEVNAKVNQLATSLSASQAKTATLATEVEGKRAAEAAGAQLAKQLEDLRGVQENLTETNARLQQVQSERSKLAHGFHHMKEEESALQHELAGTNQVLNETHAQLEHAQQVSQSHADAEAVAEAKESEAVKGEEEAVKAEQDAIARANALAVSEAGTRKEAATYLAGAQKANATASKATEDAMRVQAEVDEANAKLAQAMNNTNSIVQQKDAAALRSVNLEKEKQELADGQRLLERALYATKSKLATAERSGRETSTLRGQVSQEHADAEKLKSQVVSLESELKDAAAATVAAQKDAAEATAAHATDNEKTQRQIDAARQQLAVDKAQIVNATLQEAQAKNDLENSNSARGQLEIRISRLEHDEAKLASSAHETSTALSAAEHKAAELSAARAMSDTELAQARHGKEEVEGQLAKATEADQVSMEKLAAMKDDEKRVNGKLQALTDAKATEDAKLRDMEQEITDLQAKENRSSTSASPSLSQIASGVHDDDILDFDAESF